jgi:acyl phosphate:glycerol-3-phosphate acyltransferase
MVRVLILVMQMQNLLIYALSLVAAYLFGSIPVGYLIGRSRGVDIRTLGSGNVGGTNIRRNLGFFWGALVGFLDFLKGLIPAFLARTLFPLPWQALSISLVPIVGHIWPVFLGFKGGKGVATTFGIILAWLGPFFFIGWIVVWYLAVKFQKMMSLINLIMALTLPLFFWVFFHTPWHAVFGGILCFLIWWSHRSNIKRLLAGNETLTHY